MTKIDQAVQAVIAIWDENKRAGVWPGDAVEAAIEDLRLASHHDNPRCYCPDCGADLGNFYSNRIQMVRATAPLIGITVPGAVQDRLEQIGAVRFATGDFSLCNSACEWCGNPNAHAPSTA